MIKSNATELISTLNLTKTECPQEIRHYGSEWAVEEIKRAGLEMTQLNIVDLQVLFQDGYAPVAAYEAYVKARAATRAAKESGNFKAGQAEKQAILDAYDTVRRVELAPATDAPATEPQSLSEYEYAADLDSDDTLREIVRLMDTTAFRLDEDKASQAEWDEVNRLYCEYRGTVYLEARRWCAAVYVVDGKETTPYRYKGEFPKTARLVGRYMSGLQWVPAHE